MISTVLIVEDLAENRFLLKSILEKEQYIVTEAENGKAALEIFESATFDLVMTDIQMPKMDGLMLLRHIKRISSQTPVIIISVYQNSENIVEALRNGACDYITKPYNATEIHNSIKRIASLLESDATEKVYSHNKIFESKRYVFPTDPEQAAAISSFLCRDLEKAGLRAVKQIMQVCLIEAINNAVFHGNLEIASDIKTLKNIDSFDYYNKLAKKKMKAPVYRDRRVTVDCFQDTNKVCYTVKDEGNGFDYGKLPSLHDSMSFQMPTGRGLLMIRSLCDEVSWNATGNEITFLKFFQPP